MPAQSDITVDPKTPAKVSIQLVVAEEAPPGPQRLMLQAPHARPAVITINVIPPSPLVRVLQALAALGCRTWQTDRRRNISHRARPLCRAGRVDLPSAQCPF
jgi:hypothetical protein